jgi:hypothetical protein
MSDEFEVLSPRISERRGPSATLSKDRTRLMLSITAAALLAGSTHVTVAYARQSKRIRILGAPDGPSAFTVTLHKSQAFVSAGALLAAEAPLEPGQRYAVTPIDGGVLVQL